MKTLYQLAWIATTALATTAAGQPAAKVATKTEASTATADLSADATYLLPGAFRPDTSLDDLRRRFGANNVKLDDIAGAEGATFRGLVLFADDPQRRAEIFPRDDATQRGVAAIRVSGKKSRWHADNGLHPGMTLAELVAGNGKPLTFSGLGWDYGGNVLDWHGGRYERRKNDPVHRAVTLSYEGDVGDSVPLGDSEFRSDDSKYPQQGKLLFVGELTVSFVAPE